MPQPGVGPQPHRIDPSKDVFYQVDLWGPQGIAMTPQLHNMVETECSRCRVFLLAEGLGFAKYQQLAEERGGVLLPLCAGCARSVMGGRASLTRNLEPDYRHEEEFAAVLQRLRQG
jgi:hypothetical protein